MLAAVLAFPACFLAILQLLYSREGAAPGAGSPALAEARASTAPEGAQRSQPSPGPAAAGPAGVQAPPAASVPAPPPDRTRELALSDCVERKARTGGVDEIPQTLPGRWPALKRAREVQRLRRLELRAACDRELSGQAF